MKTHIEEILWLLAGISILVGLIVVVGGVGLPSSKERDAYWLCTEDETGEKLDLPRSAAANAVALHCVKHKIERRT